MIVSAETRRSDRSMSGVRVEPLPEPVEVSSAEEGTLLVKAQKLLRGSAVLAGRACVELRDLAVLRFVTSFRVPPEVHEKVPTLIERAAADERGDVA